MTSSSYEFRPLEVRGLKAPVAVATDVVFGRGGGRDLKLDLYRPADGKESLLPAVVFIHGGGWHGGEKESYRDLAARVASHGYACASVDYRVSVDAPFPAALEDCKCAVRWLRARAAGSRADPRRIAVWGHSAGGHLAAMVALTPGQFEGEGGSSHVPSRAQCALCCSAPFDLAALWQTLRPAVEQFLGAAAVDRAAACARASPISYVAGSATPFLVCHGGEDDLVPVKQSDAFVAALRAAEAPVEFLRMAGIGHDLDQQSAEVFGRALTFLDTHLKPSPA